MIFSKLRIFIAFISINLHWSSGTFIYYPPPPKTRASIDLNLLEQGKTVFEKKFSKGSSCSSCHGDGMPKALRRRTIHKNLNKLLSIVNKCYTNSQRIGEHQELKESDQSYKALKLFLVHKFQLLEYLNNP